MKMQTFDRSLIRVYMESNSSVLAQGIRYCQHIKPGITGQEAKETAIRLATEYCETKWYNDSSGYISNERIAFQEFAEDVQNRRYFYVKGMKDPEAERRKKEEERRKKEEQEMLWRKEKNRVIELKAYCEKNGLDFKTENDRVVHMLKKKDNLALWVALISAVLFFGAPIMWLFTSVGNFLLWLAVAAVGVVGFCVGAKIDPKVPNDFFKKIEDGTYNFDQ